MASLVNRARRATEAQKIDTNQISQFELILVGLRPKNRLFGVRVS